MRTLILLCFFMSMVVSPALGEERPVQQDPTEQAAWREDLAYADQRLRDVHPNLFWRTSEAEYSAWVQTLHDDIPYLTDDQIALEFAKLAAIGGGHTYVWLLQDQIGYRLYPLVLYWFSDGLFVIDARNPDWVGAKVVGVGDQTTEAIFEKVKPYISTDNDMGYLLWSPLYFVTPEILEALEIIDDPTQPAFLLQHGDSEPFVANPAPGSVSSYFNWLNRLPVGLPQDDEVLYLRDKDQESFWYTVLEDSNTVYVQYNVVETRSNSGLRLSQMSNEIEALVEEGTVDRIVVDVRHNGGGDNTTYHSLLSLLRREDINTPGRVFVITGRMTFSAAQNFVTDVSQSTEAIFVGEPTGSRPNHYGDSIGSPLPNAGFMLNVAPQYLQDSTADDTSPWIAPDLETPLSSADYFSGRDPAMEAILAYS